MLCAPPPPLPSVHAGAGLPTIAAVVGNETGAAAAADGNTANKPSSSPPSSLALSAMSSSTSNLNNTTSGSPSAGIEHLLTCPICLERYSSTRLVPKLLPCHHSFCVLCLESLQPEKDQYQCPTCRKAFERPSTGKMADLQTNFYVVAILESRNSPTRMAAAEQQQNISQQQMGANLNDVANGLGCRLHSKPLTFYCSTCSLFICNQCILDHNKKLNHSIEDLDHYIDHCKVTLADRSAVAAAAQEARQQYVKTLKGELEASATRDSELSSNIEQLFRELFIKLGEIRRKIDDEGVANSNRINARLKSEINRMESEAERLDTVRRLCDDVRGRNDLRTLAAVYSSPDLLDIVNNFSNPIQTVPRAVVSTNDQPIRDLLDQVHKFVQGEQASTIFACSEVKRPVIVLPKPSNASLSPTTETCGDADRKLATCKLSSPNSDGRENLLSPIAESMFSPAVIQQQQQQQQKFNFDQQISSQKSGIIEIDNVPVRLREKPARRVASSQQVDEYFHHRSSQILGSTTEENFQLQQRDFSNQAKHRHYRRSLVELRSNQSNHAPLVISQSHIEDQPPGGQTAKSTPGGSAGISRHQVISYHPQQHEVIVPQHQSKSSSTYLLSSSVHHVGATIASNSSSGASSAGDRSSASDGLKMSPPNAGGDSVVGNSNVKTPFIFEFDDADSADGSDDDGDRQRDGRHRRYSSSSKLHKKIRAGVAAGMGSPPKGPSSKGDKPKKFSLGRAISELFGKRPTAAEGRRGEEKVAIRAVPLATTSGGNSSGGAGTVTSSDSGGDQHSLASGGAEQRVLTPGQMRCVSLESVALPMSGPSSKSSSNQQTLSPSVPHPALAPSPSQPPMVTSPQLRVPVKAVEKTSDRRFSGDFTKRLHMHLPSKSKVTGGPQPQSTPSSSNTRSVYVTREERKALPVVFPSQPQQQTTSKPPPFQAVQTAVPAKSRQVPTTVQSTGQEVGEIVNALLVASTASSSHIHFNSGAPVSCKSSSTSEWQQSPTFCQLPVLKFGRQGSAPGTFDWPESVALAPSGSELYVGDFKNHRIEAFNSTGDYLYEFSVRDGMIDYYPGHMAIDPRGDRIVFPWLEKEGTGYVASNLVAFTKDGRFLTKYSHRDFGCPRAVAINSRSEMFVADQQKGCIFVLDRDGRRIRTIGKRGSTAPGEFNHPCHVALGRNNEIIVADQNNNRIQVFDTRGGICEVLTHRFTRPCCCAVDTYGNMLVADGSNKISILSLNTAVPSRSPVIGMVESSEDRLRGPRGLAVDNNGSLWVCDVGNFCVKKFDYSDLLPSLN